MIGDALLVGKSATCMFRLLSAISMNSFGNMCSRVKLLSSKNKKKWKKKEKTLLSRKVSVPARASVYSSSSLECVTIAIITIVSEHSLLKDTSLGSSINSLAFPRLAP